jgi:hypothetical protein
MSLTRETFGDELDKAFALGWRVTSFTRYDPTTITGITPTGKSFSASAVRQGAGALVTVTVAGNTRTTTLANWEMDCEPADKTWAALISTWQKLPVAQR